MSVSGPRPENLDALFRPRSVAVVGASRNPRSIGFGVVANLLGSGFVGPIYPVNPKADSVHSVPAWPSLASIPGDVDLAILTVPRDLVLPIVREAIDKGVRGIVTITAGFAEIGGAGAELEAELQRLLRASGVRMVGPNCMGLVHTDPAVRLNASFAGSAPPPGNVAFASQSGALGEAILETAASLGLGLSCFVSLGNKADVSGNDLLEYWAEDDRTRLVLLYLESFGNPRRFAELARRTALERGKPILAVKSGRSRRGAEAASSHTGSLAGTDAAVAALMNQCGVIRANTVDDLFTLAQGFATQPIPRGRRIGILTNAGGPAIMATDAAAFFDLEFSDLAPATLERIGAVLAPEASLRNPVDMIASAGPEQYRVATEAMLVDPSVDGLIVIFVSPVTMDAAAVARSIVEGVAAGRATLGDVEKPVLSCFMGKHRGDEGRHALREASIPVYPFPEDAAQTLAAMVQFGEFRRRPLGRVPTLKPSPDRASAAAIVGGARGRWMRFPEVMGLLEAYGIPVAPWARVEEPSEAARFGDEHGYPLVVKLDSDTVLHRTERGGVAVDLRNEREIAGAFWEIKENLEGVEGDHRLIVQTMVKGGTETLVGASADPAFGHLVAFGLGGIFVELMKDVVFGVLPLTDADAGRMIEGIRGFPLLQGARGGKPVDLDALRDVLLRVAQLVTDLPEIAELDLNPFFAHPDAGAQAVVDGRIRVEG